MPKSIPARLEEFGATLHSLFLELPEHDAITDTLDYLLGALFGLSHAHELGFRDRGGKHFSVYRAHLANYALNIPKSEKVNNFWLAGFYFNSAIQRVASAFDRIPQMLGAKLRRKVRGNNQKTSAKDRMKEVNSGDYVQWEHVYDEINVFKHAPEGKAAGRGVTMAAAMTALEEVLSLLDKSVPTLKSRYK